MGRHGLDPVPSGFAAAQGQQEASRTRCRGGGVRMATRSGPGMRRARLPSEEDPVTATEVTTVRAGDRLVGRVAFVTGGPRGIGAAICRSLASQGAEVAAGYSGNQQAADAFCA